HPRADLSAYIDQALDPADRNVVDGHLVACTECRTHVAQLRATTALLRALPDPIPSRHLVPRLGAPAWMPPLRTLMTLASGAAVFLFIASSLVSNITFLAGAPTTASSRDAAAEGAARAPAPVAPGDTRLQAGSGAAAPAVSPAPTAQTAFSVAGPSASPSVADSARGVTTDDAAKRAEQSTPAPPAAGGVTTASGGVTSESQPRPSPLLSPWLWLGVAILSGAFAIALHRRLRSAA
ncbi:MAG TPA: zf-HC2 domain-containing protein, partial [Candidatus Limnocylindria bacterium]|nr:zf-HC2 domain-containing protein [Candidatus Limnocylindria bacterium]